METKSGINTIHACPKFHIQALSSTSAKQYPAIGQSAMGDSGVDLRFPEDVVLKKKEKKEISLRVRVWCEVNGNSVPFLVVPRSSIGKTPLIAEENIIPILGVKFGAKLPMMQYSFTGEDAVELRNPSEIVVTLTNTDEKSYTIAKGVSLFQLTDCFLRTPSYSVEYRWTPGEAIVDSPPESKFTFAICPLPSAAKAYAGFTRVAHLPMVESLVCPPKKVTDISLGVRAACALEGPEGDVIPCGYWMVPFFEDTPLILKNWIGLIDKGYRGELKAKVYNSSDKEFVLEKGTPAFGLLVPFPKLFRATIVGEDHPEFVQGATARGNGAFGSTGAAGKA